MGNSTLLEKVKDLVYRLVLPLYLWSIGFKTLDEYITALENDYKISQFVEIEHKGRFYKINKLTGERIEIPFID